MAVREICSRAGERNSYSEWDRHLTLGMQVVVGVQECHDGGIERL
jgi:hypothetical protein